MIPRLSSTAMFWIGVVAVVVRVVFIDVMPALIGPPQTGNSPTIGLLYSLFSTVVSVASGVGFAFIAGAFVVRHLELRAEEEAKRSVHFIGRAARKEE